MHIRLRQFISGLLAALLVILSVPQIGWSATSTAITLEQSIQIVRKNFTVPAELTEFKSSFSQSETGNVWYMVWSHPDPGRGNFTAQVDASTGEVISMNTWNPAVKPQSRIPAISWPEAQKIATDLLQRLIPNRLPYLVLIEDLEPLPLTSDGPPTYTINWRRIANQIPVEGIGAWVAVNAGNGQIEGYSLNWSPLAMPDPKGIISSAGAADRLEKEALIKLQYVEPTTYVPTDTGMDQRKPLLVYRLDHPSGGALDAFTGDPVIPEYDIWFSGGGANGKGGAEESAVPSPPPPLTPEEQAEIIKIAGLISSEQAAGIITQWAKPGNGLVLRSANLDQEWQNPDRRIWSISWSSGSSADKDQNSYLYGRVDAKSGELLSFSLGLPIADQASSGLSRTSAQNMAAEFLHRIQGDRFTQFKLDPDNPANLSPVKLPTVSAVPNWVFHYIRMANGLDFPDNGADVTIDRSRGLITSYSLNWNYSELPSSDGAIGIEKAIGLYLEAAPLELMYAPYYSAAKGDTLMRLVYKPQIPPGQPVFRMIAAHTGDLLDDSGKPVIAKVRAHVFHDISGNFAAREIALLGKAGLMTEYGDYFRPAEEARLADLLRAMLGATAGLDSIRNLSDEDLVKQAMEKGWLKETLPPDSRLSRASLSQLMVRFLGIDYLAGLSDIYRIPSRDSGAIEAELQGYTALCWGLGIIRGDGSYFRPQQLVSRAEAAAALVRSLGVVK